MGAVYRARDLRFTGVARICALKEMTSTAPDPQMRRLALQNFDREANVLASLNHPAIPKIYDYFTEGIRSYLVLEYIEGDDLEALLGDTEQMLSEERVVHWAIQICEVLSYLHSQDPSIVFRDMKPSNIMLRHPNHIVLIDFGIAKAAGADDLYILPELVSKSLHHAFYQSHIAKDQTRSNGVYRISPDRAGRADEIDSREFCSALKQRFSRNPNSGRDRTAQVVTLR